MFLAEDGFEVLGDFGVGGVFEGAREVEEGELFGEGERLKKVMARQLSRDSRLSRRARDNGLMIFTYRGTAD